MILNCQGQLDNPDAKLRLNEPTRILVTLHRASTDTLIVREVLVDQEMIDKDTVRSLLQQEHLPFYPGFRIQFWQVS